jgi:hypothetical protein
MENLEIEKIKPIIMFSLEELVIWGVLLFVKSKTQKKNPII